MCQLGLQPEFHSGCISWQKCIYNLQELSTIYHWRSVSPAYSEDMDAASGRRSYQEYALGIRPGHPCD